MGHHDAESLVPTFCKIKGRFRKKSDICVVLHLSSLRRTLSTPHSSRFARLDLELFTKPSEFRLFYEWIKNNQMPKFSLKLTTYYIFLFFLIQTPAMAEGTALDALPGTITKVKNSVVGMSDLLKHGLNYLLFLLYKFKSLRIVKILNDTITQPPAHSFLF